MEYSDYVSALASQDTELASELAGFHNLERVLAWMKQRNLPLGSLDLVTQDEFAHDVLIPLNRAIAGWLSASPDSAS